MPSMDGYELARRLRASRPSLRIVAVTGFGQPSDRTRSRESGFDDHIVKPVNIEILRRVAKSLGERWRARRIRGAPHSCFRSESSTASALVRTRSDSRCSNCPVMVGER